MPKHGTMTAYPVEYLCHLVRIARRDRPHELVAEEVGVSAQTLRNVEAGEPVSMHTLQTIVNWTGCPVVVEPAEPATMKADPHDVLNGTDEEVTPIPEGEDPDWDPLDLADNASLEEAEGELAL